MEKPLLLVGCGKMGGAMLDGWINHGSISNGVYVIEPDSELMIRFKSKDRVRTVTNLTELPLTFSPSVVILALKPQIMDEVLDPLVRFVDTDTVFLSIAAGKTIEYFETKLGSKSAIVRAMPNTPAAIGQGITVYTCNSKVSSIQSEECGKLLSAIGATILLDDEGLLDAVTAVSGSGPAYVFLLIEAMAAAGVKAGLEPELSMQLARATVSGSAKLARLSDERPSQLRENVTSPGGTTAAALEILMGKKGILPVFDRAIAAATKRSKELAS